MSAGNSCKWFVCVLVLVVGASALVPAGSGYQPAAAALADEDDAPARPVADQSPVPELVRAEPTAGGGPFAAGAGGYDTPTPMLPFAP